MNWKKIAPLVIAVVLGLVAMKLAMNVSGKKTVVTVPAAAAQQIVIAKQDVPAGQAITDLDVTLGEIAGNTAPDSTFTNVADVVGRVPTVQLVPGQAVIAPLLAPKGTGAGLAALVPAGMRALTLEVNEFSGVAGYVTAGSHVDILQTMHDEQNADTITRPIVQNVKVTAIGQRRAPGSDAPPETSLHSVTLLVTPEQAEKLELASMSGRPRLILRTTGDNAMVDDHGVTLSELRGHGHTHGDIFNTVRPIEFTQPATQPASENHEPTTKPSAPPVVEDWQMELIRGANYTVVHFPMPHSEDTTSSQYEGTH